MSEHEVVVLMSKVLMGIAFICFIAAEVALYLWLTGKKGE